MNVLSCSFCHKSQDSVSKLISSPSDYPMAYICDECIVVCASILEDDRERPAAVSGTPVTDCEKHPPPGTWVARRRSGSTSLRGSRQPRALLHSSCWRRPPPSLHPALGAYPQGRSKTHSGGGVRGNMVRGSQGHWVGYVIAPGLVIGVATSWQTSAKADCV
jgi:hypothetical protein